MFVNKDICPKSGLSREIFLVETIDNIVNKTLTLSCDVKYYNPNTNEYLGDNLLEKGRFVIVLNNDNKLEGISEYDYWKGLMNDFSGMQNKGITSFDTFCSYVVMKCYLGKKIN